MLRDLIQAEFEAAVSTVTGATVEHSRAQPVDEGRMPFASAYDGVDVIEFAKPWTPGQTRPATNTLTVPVRLMVTGQNERAAMSALFAAVVTAIRDHAPLWTLLTQADGGLVSITKTSEVSPGEYAVGQAVARFTFKFID